MNKSVLVGGAIALFLVIIMLFWGMSISNEEVRIRNQGEAQKKVCEAYFDKMWKVLQQQAGVADQYKNAFKEIYPKLMEGRYAQGGDLMKWVQESNPNFDVSLYKTLMNSIEGERDGFFDEQKKLISINQTHQNLLQTFPSSFIVGSRPDLGIKIITSFKTEEVYKSGQENDIDLFNNKK